MKFKIEWLWAGQENLITLVCALILANIFMRSFRKEGYASNNATLLWLATVGILPIEGRLAVSIPLLKTARPTKEMGILAYLSTHHYYLWSPLEKSVVILLAGLHISYEEYLVQTAPLLIIYFAFFIYNLMDSNSQQLVNPTRRKQSIKELLPFLLGIGTCMVIPAWQVLPVVTLYCLKNVPREELKSVFKIKVSMILMVAIIIIAGSIISGNQDMLKSFFPNAALGEALCFAFLVSFSLGSSSKYAGIVVILTNLYGMQFFQLILAVEFAGYLLSPIHKCVFIALKAYGTPIKMFYASVGILCSTLVGAMSYLIIMRGFL